MELYANMGFKKNPFSTFSAEEENDFLNNVYIKPLFYTTLNSDLSNGHSRFILGARGIGKTALLLQLQAATIKNNIFSVILDDFDTIPATNNEIEILRAVIEKVTTSFCLEIGRNPKLIKKLDKTQKEKLAFIISNFFQTLSKHQYESIYNKADNFKKRNFLKGIWNYVLNRPINFLISGGIEIAAETVRKSMGLPKPEDIDFYKNYIPEFSIEKFTPNQSNKALFPFKALKNVMNDLANIIHASGFKTTIVFFDKIDEYTKLSGSISAVADFLEGFLKDTTILLGSHYSLVFSLWDALKPELTNNGVRFDKIKPIDITWQPNDLKRIVNARIEYFSNGTKTIDDIIPDSSTVDSIILLSNNSPRYLFRQLSYIYDQQAEIDNGATVFSQEAVSRGQLVYAKNFEYYAIYPSKRNSKDDILKNINRLLKIGKEIIVTKDFVNTYKISNPTAMSYIQIVQDYNLVKEMTETEGNAKMYEISDPVIKHLIANGVSELKK